MMMNRLLATTTTQQHSRLLSSSMRRIGAAAAVRFNSYSNWSGILSFGGAESDFSSGALPHPTEWSNTLSFANPEADFYAGTLHDKPTSEWSHSLSFASPESDFVAVQAHQHQQHEQHDSAPTKTWSELLSFASPEADYTARVDVQLAQEWSGDLTFASPDADFVSGKVKVEETPLKQDYVLHVEQDEYLRPSIGVMAMNLASPESDICSNQVQRAVNNKFMSTLPTKQEENEKALMVDKHQLPLPRTLQEANLVEHEALVITKPTAPFEIVNVNDAWVGLCGYTREESRHETLGNLLGGAETSVSTTKFLVEELLHGREASSVITNYTKSGRKFHNHVRVGPLVDAHNQVTHFVGILQEVHDLQDAFTHKEAMQ